MSLAALPIAAILGELKTALERHSAAVVLAAPGAGKTTRIPLALLGEAWLGTGAILMLEPRRLAARMAASRMASTLGEKPGETVGYRVRLDSAVGPRTRIEVVTEGILTRRLQSDAELSGVGLLIFDEFHERSLDADLGLALALDIQRALRPDLKILVMSATLDGGAVAAVLGPDIPVITAPHRPFPVETRYLDKPRGGKSSGPDLASDMASLIRRALDKESGSVLAFLPGEGEIRRTEDLLRDLPRDIIVAPLYGALPPAEQDRAVNTAPAGRRKVVLATTIAETSLTIEGVRVVVDCGYKRSPRFNVRRGMSELDTVRVSKASAEQRRGRAGRLEPGVCYRLWTQAEDRGLAAFDEPEMLTADLAPLALDLAAWGVADPADLTWMTPPPAAAFGQGTALLKRLDALDAAGRITAEGKAMAAFPLHPRLAHMIHRAKDLGALAVACDVAALLAERDILRTRDADLRTRLEVLGGQRSQDASRGAVQRVREAAKQIRGLARCKDQSGSSADAGILTALAYPDRIAQRRGAGGKYRLAGGGGAVLDPADPLAAQEFLAVADLGGAGREGQIYLAAPVAQAEIEAVFAADITEIEDVVWDSRARAVMARAQKRLGALVLADRPLRNPDPDAVLAALLTGIRELGLAALPWTSAAAGLRTRVEFLRRTLDDAAWPDMSDAALLGSLETWLGPFAAGITRADDLGRLDLHAALTALLPWPLPARLDELAPVHLQVPSGSHIAVDYGADGGPSLSVKMQEVFGLTATPAVAGGRAPVTLHLLSPAQRPLAVTRDLASFWANVYPQVRGEMRGRYPRHNWPEDPVAAAPMKRSLKPRGT
ncbi:MAG: ATP-dependent helicase HrpB [Rhodospirillaceae bacterium]